MPCNRSCPNKGIIVSDSGVFFRILGYLRNRSAKLVDSQEIKQYICDNLKTILKWIAECSQNEKIIIEESVYNEELDLLNPSSTIAQDADIFSYYSHHELVQDVSGILLGILEIIQITEEELIEFSSQFSDNRSTYIKKVGVRDKKSIILLCKQGGRVIFISQDSELRTAVRELSRKSTLQIGGEDFTTQDISEKPLEEFLRQPYVFCKITHEEYHTIFLGLLSEMANSLARMGSLSANAMLQNILTMDNRSMKDAFDEKRNRKETVCWNGIII